MTEISEGELLLRLVLACVLGGIIGYERQSRHKSAGLRTNMLVCLGSCLVMATCASRGIRTRIRRASRRRWSQASASSAPGRS